MDKSIIIIMDADSTTSEFIGEYLDLKFVDHNISCKCFDRGNDAWNFIKKKSNQIEVIISDSNHFGLKRFELLKLCKKTFPFMAFILLISYGPDFDIGRKYTEFVLYKPVLLEKIFEIVSARLNKKVN